MLYRILVFVCLLPIGPTDYAPFKLVINNTIPAVKSQLDTTDPLPAEPKPAPERETELPQVQLRTLPPGIPTNVQSEPEPEPEQLRTIPTETDEQLPISNYTIPKTEIGGADQPYPYGELVQLWVKASDRPNNLHSVNYSWTVLPSRRNAVWPDATKFIFSSGIKKPNSSKQFYTVILTASYVFVTKENDVVTDISQKIVTTTATIQVGTDDDPITDNPTDDHRPPPTWDNSPLTGLAKSAKDWVGLVVRTNSYRDQQIKTDALKLAKSFADHATKVDDGELTSVSEIVEATRINNDKIISNNIEWDPWFTKITEYLSTQFDAQKITTPADFAKSWRSISMGLHAAATEP